MPDDRLDDLGEPGGGDRRGRSAPPDSAAERLAGADERDSPPAEPGPSERARPYVVAVGALLVGLAAVIVVAQTLAPGWLAGSSTGSESVRGPRPGEPLPVFAAPLATGQLEGDVNVTPSGATSGAGGRPACSVHGPGVVNLCELRRRPLVMTFVVREGTECESAIGVFERVARDHPEIAFLVVVSGERRAAVEELVRARGLSVPVAVDPDGALVNLYRVGVCPTTTFALPGGRVLETRLGNLGDSELRSSVKRLAERSRRR